MDTDACKPTEALDDDKLCVEAMGANSISGGISEHGTATRYMPASTSGRPILAFFNRAKISSRIKRMIPRMMQRRSGDAARVVSFRIAEMMQTKSEYASATEFEIEASKVHWSELNNPTSDDEDEETTETDLEVFQSLKKKWGGFFMHCGDDVLRYRCCLKCCQTR